MSYSAKQRRECFVFVLLFLFISIQSTVSTEPSPLQLTSRLSKPSYLEGEPIVILLRLINVGQKELKVAELLVREGFLKIVLKDAEGKDVNIPRLVWDILMPPQDYGIQLAPGKSLEMSWSLNKSYPFGLEVGSYRVTPVYNTARYASAYPQIWHGVITGDELRFDVKAPTGTEIAAWNLFKGARDILSSRSSTEYPKAGKIFSDLIAKYPDSVYVPYASYLIGESYYFMQADNTQHFAEAVPAFKSFLARFPNYPYYSDSARSYLAFSLHKTGQNKRALQILEQVPDGRGKDNMLKIINSSLKE
jgi:tetratricopeptide (TPR) repeat protein